MQLVAPTRWTSLVRINSVLIPLEYTLHIVSGQCNPQSSAAIQGKAIGCVASCGADAAASALKAATDICNW